MPIPLKADIADTNHNAQRRAYFRAASESSGASVLDRSHRSARAIRDVAA
jgi:hypothetical protein